MEKIDVRKKFCVILQRTTKISHNKMKEIIEFLTELADNNNKQWFDEHKERYKEVKAKWDDFSLKFMAGVEQFDSRIQGLQLKDITYRIYRDLRFTHDKRPYKWHFGTYVCPKGKKSGMGGYYIHIEPSTDTYFLCGGLYCPDKATRDSVREEIMLEPDGFHDALQQCPDFVLPWDSALKNVPKGFSPEDKHAEYYRLKSYEVYKHITKADVLRKDFLASALEDLKRTQPFTEILNRCFDYAHEDR